MSATRLAIATIAASGSTNMKDAIRLVRARVLPSKAAIARAIELARAARCPVRIKDSSGRVEEELRFLDHEP